MTHIAIDKPPLVFDDPEFCAKNGTENMCENLILSQSIGESDYCGLWPYSPVSSWRSPEFKKHDECKKAWKKAIEAKKKETDLRTQHQKQMDKHFIGH